MTETRGSWNLERAIVEHWRDAGLDESFRATWDDPTNAEYQPLNDGEARPEPPGPYCVYALALPRVVGNSSGTTPETVNTELAIPLEFRVHARTSGRSSGKRRAADLAALVAGAFDPQNALPICDDAWIRTDRGGDYCQRLGNDEWVWIIFYEVHIDAVYDARP